MWSARLASPFPRDTDRGRPLHVGLIATTPVLICTSGCWPRKSAGETFLKRYGYLPAPSAGATPKPLGYDRPYRHGLGVNPCELPDRLELLHRKHSQDTS